MVGCCRPCCFSAYCCFVVLSCIRISYISSDTSTCAFPATRSAPRKSCVGKSVSLEVGGGRSTAERGHADRDLHALVCAISHTTHKASRQMYTSSQMPSRTLTNTHSCIHRDRLYKHIHAIVRHAHATQSVLALSHVLYTCMRTFAHATASGVQQLAASVH